jgi:fibronectin-binding autotransporter adhesin
MQSLKQHVAPLSFILSVALFMPAGPAPAAVYTWTSSTTGGSWSVMNNWTPTGSPTTGDTASLLNATADRVIFYDPATSGTLSTLSFTQSSAFKNELQVQRGLTVTNAITLNSSSGTARLSILGTSADTTLTSHAGITVNGGGMLSLGNNNPTSTTIYSPYVNGNVTVSGGVLEVADVNKAGTYAGTAFSVLNNNLTMTSGTITVNNATITGRRLQVSGSVNVSGGAVTATNSGAEFWYSGVGVSSTFAPSSFDSSRIVMILGASGDQSLAAGINLGTVQARASGIKTFSSTSGTFGQLQLFDGSATATTTFRLASNATATSSPAAQSFGNTADAGRIDLGIDTDKYVLTLPAAGGFTPNASAQAGVTNTVWNLSGTAGTLKAALFNFNSGSTTVNIGQGLVLEATGGNSTANVLSGSGTINSTATFRYSGAAASATPATLTSARAFNNLEVAGTGALRLLSLAAGPLQSVRVASGSLDLAGSSLAVSALSGSAGGTITSSSNAAMTLTAGDATSTQFNGVITNSSGTLQLTKVGAGTLTLGGANTFNGLTTISEGTLKLTGGSNRLATSGTLTFAPATTLTLDNAQQLSRITVPDTSGTATIGSAGSLTLTNALVELGPATSTTSPFTNVVDMSGLGGFAYNNAAGTLRVGLKSVAGTNNQNSLTTVTLGGSNTITAATLAVSDQSGASTGGTATLRLGSANTVNTNNIGVGQGRANGTITFAPAGGTATVRGAAGGTSAVTLWNIGQVSSFNSNAFSATADFSSGTLDANVATLTIGVADAFNSPSRAGVVSGTFSMAAGTLTSGTISIGRIQASGTGTGTGPTSGNTFAGHGVFTLNGGVVDAQSIEFATNLLAASAGTQRVSGTFNLQAGTLRATTIGRGAQTGGAIASTGFNWTNGTIENKAGSDLTVSSLPITLLAGSHTFNTAAGRSITLDAASTISGASGITKTGAGTLVISSSNAYSGATALNAGTTLVNGSLASAVSVASAATLGGSGTVFNAVSVDGILSPGTSPGILSMNTLALSSSATTIIEIAAEGTRGTDFDGVNILNSGELTYGGALSFAFGPTAFNDNASFTIFSFSGTPSGDFTSVASTGYYDGLWSNIGGGQWQSLKGSQTLTFSQPTGTLAIVPEPAAVLSAGLGIAVMAGLRRRLWRHAP